MEEISNKQQAQRQADRVREFREYLDQLEKESVLTLSADQRQRVDQHLDHALEALAKRFDIDLTESQRQISLSMGVIWLLGGLALCIALFLFLDRIWGLVTTPVQVAILIATPLVLLAATKFAIEREKTLYFASLFFLVAMAAFVLDLSTLGTIFNITPSHKAFLAWGAFALILAYRFRLRLLLVAGLLSLMAFLSASLMTWQGWNWLTFGERPENFIGPGLILFAIPKFRSMAEFDPVYRIIGSLAVFIPLFGLGESGYWTYLPFDTKNVEHLYQLLGFATAAFAIWFGITRRYREVLNLGAAFFAIFLISRFAAWWWDWMPKYLFFLVVGAIALGLLTAFRRLHARVGSAA